MNSNTTTTNRAAAYWAKPFAVRWCDSHFSGTFKFDTLDEAYEYIACQWRQVRARCARKTMAGSWIASCLWDSYLETPAGRMKLTYVLLADDVTNRP